MARTRRGSNLSVSLFPFLSILCCIIGTLTLLLAGIAAGKGVDGEAARQAKQEEEEYVRVLEEKKALAEKEKTQAEEEISELSRLIAQAEALAKKLESARNELKRWEGVQKDAAVDEKSCIDALATIDDHRTRIAEMKEAIAKREQEIKEQREHPEKRNSYVILGSGKNLSPRFVECVREGIWLDPNRPEPERRLIRPVEIKKSTAFKAFLQEAWEKANGTVIFVVREGGVDPHDYAWSTARQEAKGDRNKRMGSMPIPGALPVDYSAFIESGSR